MKLLGSVQIRNTAYRPIANGIVEGFYQQLKTAFKSYPYKKNSKVTCRVYNLCQQCFHFLNSVLMLDQ